MNLKLRIANNTDTSCLFSASLRGGVRGFADAVAVESHSNNICPCIKTVSGFVVIVEPKNNNEMEETNKDINIQPKILCSRRTAEGKQLRREGIERFADRELQPKDDDTSNAITTVQKDNLLMEQIPINTDSEGNARTINTHYQDMNMQSVTDKSHDGYGYVRTAVQRQFRIRKLTERECFRLMGVDDSDIDIIQASKVSRSQQYKLAGNSIVVDVLCAIFDKMFINKETENLQLKLF